VVGTFVSILIGRQVFGGNGGNPFNPALIGWAAVRLSWYDHINFDIAVIKYNLAFSAEYPLSVLKNSGYKAASQIWGHNGLFMGDQIGGIGTAMILLVIVGGVILLVRGVITWEIPLFFIVGTALGALVFWLTDSSKYADPLFHILTGNVMFGAFFLATDYASSPVNRVAKIIFALGCGIFTVIFRVWSKYPDGVVFAILLMNIMNPLIDKICPAIPGKPKSEERA
jgi:electron transport complex protein RnfD